MIRARLFVTLAMMKPPTNGPRKASRASQSPADVLAARAGVSLREVARQFPSWERRMSEKKLANRVKRIRALARHGGLDDYGADCLAHLMKCDPQVFLYGLAAYSALQKTQ